MAPLTVPQGSRPGDEVVDLLARLVTFETESRTPNAALVEFCADYATRAGATARVVPGAPGRSNLHLRFGPDTPGGVLLAGHTDVVPAGSGWSSDPYRLTEAEGKLYGRGTADMKGFIAVALALGAGGDHRRLQAPLHVALSYDEEIGCVGVAGLLDDLSGQPACRPEAVVVGEPTMMRLCVAHTGKVAYRVLVTASAAHSSEARHRPSAISAATRLCTEIHALNTPDDPSRGFASANVGTIEGGTALNVLSSRCELTFETRFDASVDSAELLAPVRATMDQLDRDLAAVGGSMAGEQIVGYPALATPPSSPAVELLSAVVDGSPPGAIDFGCEGGLYAQHLGVPTVILGPGSIGHAHRPDEFVTRDQLQRCQRVLADTVRTFCCSEEPATTPSPARSPNPNVHATD
ncbi:acetylornithine deacetylase [Candidatus Poriferisocius sp.]|uniref:acetylornithine deacetylase n=1 Tax=Candidatus Poriferisocius sp. TaxID=3101276 RepID=UPI003B5A7E35